MRIQMQGMVVHREQAEEVVVVLRDRFARPVLVGRSDLELLEITPELHPAHASTTCAGRSERLRVSVGALLTAGIPFRSCKNAPSSPRDLPCSLILAGPAGAPVGHPAAIFVTATSSGVQELVHSRAMPGIIQMHDDQSDADVAAR
jgi:hypothetical protein